MHLHLSGFYKFLSIVDNRVFQMNCWFEGHVQGVGFRYQTVSVAKGFDVTGYVQNMVDGRVHLYAEGREAVETEIKEQGGRLARVEKPRLSLDDYFLKEVHERENERAKKQEGGESV